MAFDGTDNILSTPERMTTTTPNQALLVFNNDWILQRAAKLAAATMPKVDSLNSAVNQLYLKLFGRNVTDKEWQIASERTQSSEQLFTGKTTVMFFFVRTSLFTSQVYFWWFSLNEWGGIISTI